MSVTNPVAAPGATVVIPFADGAGRLTAAAAAETIDLATEDTAKPVTRKTQAAASQQQLHKSL